MSYTLTDNEAKLPRAITALMRRPNVKGQCLGFVRAALGTIGLRLPPRDLLVKQTGHSTALACYHELTKDPEKYGWVKVSQPESHPVLLCFFHNTGVETANNGATIECGHIALLQGDTLYASMDYPNTAYFQSRLIGFFIPA